MAQLVAQLLCKEKVCRFEPDWLHGTTTGSDAPVTALVNYPALKGWACGSGSGWLSESQAA